MCFAAIFVPDFPVEAMVRMEPELREQAVAVVDGTPPLLHVVACNPRAREAGVDIGMTKLAAEARLSGPSTRGSSQFSGACPERSQRASLREPGVPVRRRSPAQEAAAHAALVDCACAFSPRVEDNPNAPDTIVLDLAGLERLFGPPAKIARELARRASDLKLEVNVAVAANIEAAFHAARGFAGVTVIPPGEEAERLGTLPIEVMLGADHGRTCDKRTTEILDTLARWGVRTFRALAALPETALCQRLGQTGVRLRKLARGEGSRPLVPSEPPLQFEETIELENPVVLLEPLAFLLNHMLEQVCARLATRALSTQEIRLRLGLEPRLTEPALSRAEGLRSANLRHREYVLRLPVPMLDAKVFLKLLQLELRAKPPAAPVNRIVLGAEPAAPRFLQGGLFLPAVPEPQELEVMLARINNIVYRSIFPASGESASGVSPEERNPEKEDLHAGAAELLDTHRPDAFRLKKFSGAVSRTDEIPTSREMSALRPCSALRRFRPPQPVNVRVANGRPVTVMFDQRSRIVQVLWAAGPWCESGEWWTQQPWSREVWDVAWQQAGAMAICRIYRDTSKDKWFMEASYD